MIKIKDVVLDTAGNGVHRATVAITQYPSGAAAILYSDNGITALPSNSVLTDEKGQYEFYIPNGRYTVTVSKTGATTVSYPDAIQAYDGSGVTITTGKSFSVLNTITLAGTDGTTITLPSASTVLAGRDAAQTFTGLQTFATGLTSAGVVTVNNNLTVTGPAQFATIAASGAVSFSSTLGVTGLSTLGSLTVTGATTLASLTVSGAFNPSQVTTGAVTSSALSAFNAGLTATTIQTSGVATLDSAIITNNASVGGTLGVTGAATFNGATINGAATLGSTLGVTGASTLAGVTCTTLAASGNTTVGGTLGVTGATTLAAATATSLSINGSALSLAGNLTTSGAFATTLTTTGTTTLTLPTTGTLLSTASSIALTQLAQTGATTGQGIVWNGSAWAPGSVGGGGGAGSFTTLDASGATTLATTLDVTGVTTLAKGGGDTNYVLIGNATSGNTLKLMGRASGSASLIEAQGFDSSVGLRYTTKLTGAHEFRTRSSNQLQFQITDTNTVANYLSVTGAVASSAPVLSALGSDTNVDVRVTPKGTGMLSTTGLKIDEGTNKRMGVTAAMTAGSITVSTTAVTANSRIFLTAQTTGGTPGALRVSARTAGTSFTITSTSGSDTSTVAWVIMEPA